MDNINFKMKTTDLILCATLLEEEARQYDNDYSKDGQHIAKMYARDRRALKDRMLEEVERRRPSSAVEKHLEKFDIPQ